MNPYTRYPELQPEEPFRFTCKRCGNCCRNVKNGIMVESLDLFLIAKYLQLDMAEAAEKYTEAVSLAWGAPVLMMKTKSVRNACVFLENGSCGIQPVKPRACKLYPLSIGPEDHDFTKFLIFNVVNDPGCLAGREYRASEWVDANFDPESRAYITMEYRAIRECGKIMSRIPRDRENEVLFLMLRERYFLFDTDKDFMRQFSRNMAQLKTELLSLTDKKG